MPLKTLPSRLIQTLQQALAAQLYRAKPPQAPTPGRPGWFALPGCRLEYRDSGLAIALATRPDQTAYTLFDPEGRPLANANPGLLAQLQGYAETMAAERAAFVYHPISKDSHEPR